MAPSDCGVANMPALITRASGSPSWMIFAERVSRSA